MKYDQHENCAKCGYPGKTVEYCAEPWRYPQSLYPVVKEELCLTCTRCGWKWFRDCLDKEEA